MPMSLAIGMKVEESILWLRKLRSYVLPDLQHYAMQRCFYGGLITLSRGVYELYLL